eukprot:gene29530-35639_t
MDRTVIVGLQREIISLKEDIVASQRKIEAIRAKPPTDRTADDNAELDDLRDSVKAVNQQVILLYQQIVEQEKQRTILMTAAPISNPNPVAGELSNFPIPPSDVDIQQSLHTAPLLSQGSSDATVAMYIRIAADALGIKTKLVSIIAKCFLRGSIQRVQDSHDTNKFFTDVVVKGKAKHTAQFSAKVHIGFRRTGDDRASSGQFTKVFRTLNEALAHEDDSVSFVSSLQKVFNIMGNFNWTGAAQDVVKNRVGIEAAGIRVKVHTSTKALLMLVPMYTTTWQFLEDKFKLRVTKVLLVKTPAQEQDIEVESPDALRDGDNIYIEFA